MNSACSKRTINSARHSFKINSQQTAAAYKMVLFFSFCVYFENSLFRLKFSFFSVIFSKGTALLSALSAGGAGPDVDGLVDHLFEVVVVVGLENINTENMDQKVLEE